ncbi:DNA-binding SARP family transcriptional activator [Kitasatospora viridis]|uniref:DNA-binding SARP family transcriptional activator n=1 Tax=Kitasatospora viridis TaxID=281105 RepID=A0A561TVW3_9ACTN|nr:BTAD domain-containing putative transcriptional regulator [Kitasatospora viridis]TWF91248.1 DNA-binding SARP family transcriptional activator [Kitasatospora viridis]
MLGPLRVHDGETEREVNAPRQRAVLAFLLLRRNETVLADVLCDAVWNGSPPKGARGTLQSYLVRLRQSLGPVAGARLVTRSLGYAFEAKPGEADIDRFERSCSEGLAASAGGRWADARSAFAAAESLWRGDLLSDVGELAGVAQEAVRLGELRLQAVEGRIEADLHLARHAEVLSELHTLVARHPLRERFTAQLMIALYRSSRQADALLVYRNAYRVLAEEIGVEPGPELRETHLRILSADAALSTARPSVAVLPEEDGTRTPSPDALPLPDPVVPSRRSAGGDQSAGRPPEAATDLVRIPAAKPRSRPAQLPSGTAGFVGRREELDQLDQLLETAGETRTVVISAVSGMAGVGKTALAVHWAHQVAGRFPDGQLYLNLRGFDPTHTPTAPAEALRSLLDALDVPRQRIPAGLDAQAALYRSLLADRRMLVLLDNVRDAEQVRSLLPGTPDCLVLITSRDRLTGLVAGVGAHPVPLDLLTVAEARDLLTRRLGAQRTAAEPDAVDEIIERCARLPLALAVVSARAASQPRLPLAATAADLRRLPDRLDALTTGDPVTDVRSVFSWSYRQLSEPSARLFRLLGLHPGPDLSAGAAASLAGFTPAQVRPLLSELARLHLINEPARGRYTLHDLLRVFADEQARTEESETDRRTVTRRMLDHYLQSAHRASSAVDPWREVITPVEPLAAVTVDGAESPSAEAAKAWFAAEFQVLMAAVQLAVDAGLDHHAWQLVWSIDPVLKGGDWQHWTVLQQLALQAAGRLGDAAAEGYSHRMLGASHLMLGRHREARAHLDQSIAIFRELGDDANQGYAHHMMDRLLEQQGRPEEALYHAELASARFQAGGDRRGQAIALNAVGWLHAQLGDYQAALEHCRQALQLQQALGFRRSEADSWDSIGFAHHHLGQHAEAVDCYRHALVIFRDLDFRFGEADTLTKLGDTHAATGDTDAARDTWTAALQIFTDIGHADAEQVRAKLHDLPTASREVPPTR